jgi:hypothetical protein
LIVATTVAAIVKHLAAVGHAIAASTRLIVTTTDAAIV